MPSLHAFTNRSTLLATLQVPTSKDQSINVDVAHSEKWTYLVANHIQFTEKQAYSIRIPKPKQVSLSLWLEKIVLGGQCSTLCVEQLSLDEISFKRLKQLCLDHEVALINLMPNNTQQDNVIQGPW